MILASMLVGGLDVVWRKPGAAERVWKTKFVEVRRWGLDTEIVIGGTELIISWTPRGGRAAWRAQQET